MPVVTIGGKKVFVVPSTIPHEPIYIVGNSAFTKENGVVSGTGTKTDPYIIENWDISASTHRDGIHILHTNAHFIIRNCTLRGCGKTIDYGIILVGVTNGKVENINTDGFDTGIVLQESQHNIISNCDIRNSSDCAIYIWNADDNIIKDCKGYDNEDVIRLYKSPKNEIINCPDLKVSVTQS